MQPIDTLDQASLLKRRKIFFVEEYSSGNHHLRLGDELAHPFPHGRVVTRNGGQLYLLDQDGLKELPPYFSFDLTFSTAVDKIQYHYRPAPIIIGHDPGRQGATVAYDFLTGRVWWFSNVFKGEKPWDTFDVDKFDNQLAFLFDSSRTLCFYVEQPLFLPGNRNIGQTGMRYGMVLGALEGLNQYYQTIKVIPVKPSLWQRLLLPDDVLDTPKKIDGKKVNNAQKREIRKANIMNWVENAFNVTIPPLTPKARSRKHDGVADAFCLAMYGLGCELGFIPENKTGLVEV